MIGTRFQLDEWSTPHLDTHVDAVLPAASWLATVTGGTVHVVCGHTVERTAVGVAEGCWDEPFEAFDLDRAANVFGSGIRVRKGAIAFVAPSHTLEGLFVHETADRLVVSNSLAFLIERERLDLPVELPICTTLSKVAFGSRRYPQVLALTNDGQLARFFNATLHLRGGRLDLQPRTADRRFTSYADYRNYLLETLRRVTENGSSAQRSIRYGLLTTVSSGYDSTACAALAREAGCTEAVTLTRSRFGRDDSGAAVGRSLGFDVSSFDRSAACADAVPSCTAEFVATGYGGEDLPFASFEERLPGQIIVTGFLGGTLWARNEQPSDALERNDLSGSSLGEFRMRVGFTHLPLAVVGASSGSDIAAITRSEEMKPYTLGTSYDKPIARRIAEEAGVPRASFGQTKEAVSVLGFTDFRVWPPLARASVAAFARRHATLDLRLRQAWWQTRSFVWRALRKSLAIAGRWTPPPRLEHAILGMPWVVFEHSAPITSELALRWAMGEVRPRYAKPPADAAN